MNPETKIIGHPGPAPAKHENLATTLPSRKIKVSNVIGHILHLPGSRQIITWSWSGSFRVWDLEKGTQAGEEWEDKDGGVQALALSPGDHKTVATGSFDGAVRFWNVDTGKVIKTSTGHTKEVRSVRWSLDGGRVVSGSLDGTFRVWDVESGETIVGPIKAATGKYMKTVCYSPDGKVIATGGDNLKIWDANTGKLLKTLEGFFTYLAWTSDGKTLWTGGWQIIKFETATWTQTVLDGHGFSYTDAIISLSSNERILASTLLSDNLNTAQLWNLETDQPIGTPLQHQDRVTCATFSADGKFLVTGCRDHHIYTWDVSAIIIKEASLPSDIFDATRPVPKVKGARQITPGFFDDALREANLRTRLSQSRAPNNRPTPAPRERTLSRFSSFWRRFKPHGATEPDTQSRSRPLSWTRNLVSGILRRRDGSDIQLREVEVPHTAGKPRNYHARKKQPATSSSRPPNTHITQQPSRAAQSIPPPSQLPPPTTSTHSAVPGTAGAAGIISRPRIIGAGWRARFVGCICCMPIQNADGHP